MPETAFCGKIEDRLVVSWVRPRADSVRWAIGEMMNRDSPTDGWREALGEGWRVVKVRVEEVKR